MSAADRRTVFHGRKFDLALQAITLADGTRAERELVVHPGSVALLPLLDAGQSVVLIRNHRFGLGRVLWEIPAGTLARGENPDACALRELQEETGYTARRLRKLAEWFVAPGVSDERMYVYVCDQLDAGPARLEPDERIETAIIPWTEALAMIDDGRIDDAKTALAILLWDRAPASTNP